MINIRIIIEIVSYTFILYRIKNYWLSLMTICYHYFSFYCYIIWTVEMFLAFVALLCDICNLLKNKIKLNCVNDDVPFCRSSWRRVPGTCWPQRCRGLGCTKRWCQRSRWRVRSPWRAHSAAAAVNPTGRQRLQPGLWCSSNPPTTHWFSASTFPAPTSGSDNRGRGGRVQLHWTSGLWSDLNPLFSSSRLNSNFTQKHFVPD